VHRTSVTRRIFWKKRKGGGAGTEGYSATQGVNELSTGRWEPMEILPHKRKAKTHLIKKKKETMKP